ncbi:MAG: hypothetical protein WA399_08255 [Acidobacteriaceae bacterium]
MRHTLGFSQVCFAGAQGVLGQFAFNGDTCQVRDLTDDLLLSIPGHSRLAIIHRKRRDHVALG